MSLKTLLRIFTAFSVVVSGYPQDETDCVTFIKNNKFPYDFLSELSLKRNQSVWENITRSITKFTNICLLKKNVSGCTRPVINIYFPVISQKPKIALKVLPRPYLATKDTSPNMANQVVSSLGHVWKLFVICLIAAAISGLMIWFLVSINRSLYIIFPRKASLFAERAGLDELSVKDVTRNQFSHEAMRVVCSMEWTLVHYVLGGALLQGKWRTRICRFKQNFEPRFILRKLKFKKDRSISLESCYLNYEFALSILYYAIGIDTNYGNTETKTNWTFSSI